MNNNKYKNKHNNDEKNNPKKNNLWNEMKHLQSSYYYLDKFERIDTNTTFIENNIELLKIGNEMFDKFGLDKINIKFFVDVCAAPGMYSKIIYDTYMPTGIGISLPPEKGGVEFEFKNSSYKQFYKDILEKEYKLEIPKKLDFGIASCVSYIDDKKNASTINMELILTSLNIIMNNLMEGGNLIINMTMKNIVLCYNVLYLLMKQFKTIKLWKSSTVWGTKNTFYIFCYFFTNTIYNDNIKKYIDEIKNPKSSINNIYIGDDSSFTKITHMMNRIYIIRINCWLKLLL